MENVDQGLDVLQFVPLIFSLIVLILLGWIVFRTGKAPQAAPGSEGALRVEIAEKDQRLQEALSRADRAETLAAERAKGADQLTLELAQQREQAGRDQAEVKEALAKEAKASSEAVAKGKAVEAAERALEQANATISELRGRVDQEVKAQHSLKADIATLETKLSAERIQADEKIELLSKVREEMQERFRLLADDALRSQGEAFSKANVEKLEATLTPLKEHVGHFEKELREAHQATVKDRESLRQEILQLSKRSEDISQEAVALTRALKGDYQKQGAWGEMILETILQRSGLREGEEYVTQAKRQNDEGERLRPDVVINIPGGKSLVVDSKVSLNAYADAINSDDPAEAALRRRDHIAAMRNHINTLSAKGYQMFEGASVDYVIMFVPIEGALSEALREDGSLTEYALEKNITIATPTTLMMALRTVAHVWAVERRNTNAENIAKRAGLLYDKVAGFVGSMEKVGKGIQSANQAYDTAFNQLSRGSGNVLQQVEMLKALGVRSKKSLAIEFDGKAEAAQLIAESDELEALPTE